MSSGRPARTWRQRLYDQWWGGPRGAYRRSLSRSVVAFRILACLLALGVVVALLTVADLRPIGRVQDYIGHVRGTGRVMDVTAADEPAAAVPDHPAAWVVDDVGGRGWATKWTASGGGDPDPACRNSELADPAAPGPAAGGLVLTLPAKVDVREIGIEAGLADGDDLQGSRWRPKTMELRWDDGSCQRIDLDKTADLQRFGVHAGAVGTVRLTVIAAYPPAVAGSDRLDVAEITFWQR